MKREEEIEKEAVFRYPEMTSRYIAFIKGAKYADKTILDRACEWLYTNAENYTIDGGLAIESLIYSFKKAMEGGAE